MKILILNWRDIKHPDGGGAEVFTHEIAKRWVAWGNEVTLFTARFPGGANEEVVDGVHIVRDGGRFGVYRKARRFYENCPVGRFDVVVDEINTRPFFTPRFVSDTKVVALIHQLAREFWFYETPFPISIIGRYFLEPRWLRRYCDVPVVTVSESTKNDLLKLGIRRVFIVENGIDIRSMTDPSCREKDPTIVFMGRMKKAKRPEDALVAFQEAQKRMPEMKFWFVGDGYLRAGLEKKWSDGGSLSFFGRVSEEKKVELLSQAHAVVVPGVREGWGRVVTEANAFGTPAIGYNVPGIRDSIRDGVTGLLTKRNTPQALSEEILRFFRDERLREELSQAAFMWAQGFSWDKSASKFMDILERVHRE